MLYIKHGDIINLGRHKVMCGNSTDGEDIAALMGNERAKMLFTSPPYSDIYNYSGNDLSPETLSRFIPEWKDYAEVMCVNLGIKRRNHEVDCYWDTYIDAARSAGLKLLSWNVWDKINPGSISQQQAVFPIRHEFVFVFGEKPVNLNRTIPKHGRKDSRAFRGIRDKDGSIKLSTSNHHVNEKCKQLETVIQCGAVKSRPVWGTAQMPLKLAEAYIKAVTNEGDIVIDPFGGSGTTLIACEMTGRKCLMMEISPEYCGVIAERYEKLKAEFPLLSSGLQ